MLMPRTSRLQSHTADLTKSKMHLAFLLPNYSGKRNRDRLKRGLQTQRHEQWRAPKSESVTRSKVQDILAVAIRTVFAERIAFVKDLVDKAPLFFLTRNDCVG